MKKVSLLLLLVTLSLTALLWPTGAAGVITSCLSFSVPAVTHDVTFQDHHVVVGQKVNFTIADAGAGVSVVSEDSGNFGTGAIPGLATQGFTATAPNTTTTALSCTDSFWDGNFVVRNTCEAFGDTITIFVEIGGVRTPIVTLVTVPGGVQLTQINLRLSLRDRYLGTNFQAVGSIIPYSAMGGTQTPLMTFGLTSEQMACGRLGMEIQRGSGIGSTSVIFADAVVIRDANGPMA